ncbi:hypothetical protein BT93_E1166 [Corymbia citriodora subsp. variegata]|nr:hypothetical protein BT93_E1166 [Corymbia citriodora subsp. variegata]
MRKAVLLSLLTLVLASSLVDLSRGEIQFCRKRKTYDGTCGNDGGYQCVLKFLNEFGARAMPQKCICRQQGTNQQLCSCLVVCENSVPAKPNA